MEKLVNKSFTVYITYAYAQGYYNVDVWDDAFSIYPERFNSKYIGYSVAEIKEMLTASLKAKYKPTKYNLNIEFIVTN